MERYPELRRPAQRLERSKGSAPKCLTEHPEFEDVCLKEGALRVAYYRYCDTYATELDDEPPNEYET